MLLLEQTFSEMLVVLEPSYTGRQVLFEQAFKIQKADMDSWRKLRREYEAKDVIK